MLSAKETMQFQAKEAWLKSQRCNTIVVGTGGGKSKIAIDIINEIKPISVLIIVNSVALIENWKKELEKFGLNKQDDPHVEIFTYQTAYKWDDEYWEYLGNHIGLIILDEIDFAVSPEYFTAIYNSVTSGVDVLGLTGFLPVDKEQKLEDHCSVCFRASTQELQEAGILNKSEIVFIEYPLSKERTLEIPLKRGGTFKTSENDQYKYYNTEFTKAMVIKGKLEKQLLLLPSPMLETQFKAADWKFKTMAAKRKSILHGSDNAIKVAKEVVQAVRGKGKILIFSATTKQCDKLYNPYHGKNEKDFDGIEAINNNEVDIISVAKKITRGINMSDVRYIIRESYDSSETDFNQIHGRGMRLAPGQVMKFIVLVPYYEEVVKDVTPNGFVTYKKKEINTQAAHWANNMFKSLEQVSARTIRLDHTLILPKNHNL